MRSSKRFIYCNKGMSWKYRSSFPNYPNASVNFQSFSLRYGDENLFFHQGTFQDAFGN